MQKMTRIEVELHSTEPNAADATKATIEQLGGRLEQDGGRWYLVAGDRPLDFLVWSARRQGYIRRVIE